MSAPVAPGVEAAIRSKFVSGASTASPATQETVDAETRRIVEEAERDVIDLLERERPRLDALAHALLERETLDQSDAYAIAGVNLPAVPEPVA